MWVRAKANVTGQTPPHPFLSLALSPSRTLISVLRCCRRPGRWPLPRRAMVSWNDGETNEDSIQYVSSSDGIIKVSLLVLGLGFVS